MGHWSGPALRVLFYVALVVLLLPGLQFLLGIRPPKYRSRNTPADLGLPFEAVTFATADGLRLKGWLIPGKDSRATILVTHGYPFDKGNILPLAAFLHPHYNVLLFDFRSFGESEGGITTVGYREQEDVRAAIRYLRGRGGVGEKIGGLGFSMGAATLLMTDDPALRAVVADSSYADLNLLLDRVYAFFPGITKAPLVFLTRLYARVFLGLDLRKVSPVRAIAQGRRPVLLIHGEADSEIPVAHARMLFAAAPPGVAELWIIPQAEHGAVLAVSPEEYRRRVLGFFRRTLGE